jgi:hypothetical protein
MPAPVRKVGNRRVAIIYVDRVAVSGLLLGLGDCELKNTANDSGYVNQESFHMAKRVLEIKIM